MSASSVAQALYSVYKQRATGRLEVKWAGRASALLFQDGALVGTEMGFGFQSVAQALLGAGRLKPPGLDALWARGEAGRIGTSNALLPARVEAGEMAVLQALANVQCLCRCAEEVEFHQCPVEPGPEAVAGHRVVRAGFRAAEEGPAAPERLCRCPDPSACEEWGLSEEERGWLEAFATAGFQPLHPDSLEEAALFAVLEADHKVEVISRETWERAHPAASPPVPAEALAAEGFGFESSSPPSMPPGLTPESLEQALTQLDMPVEPTLEPSLNDDSGAPAGETGAGRDEAEDVAGDPTDPPDEARLRRRRLLRRAMENMGSLPRAPDAGSGAVAPEPQPETVAPEPAAAAPEQPASASTPPDPSHAALRAQIEARHEALKSGQDYFGRLGVSRTAGKSEVKGAFILLAKTFHPDRLPPGLADVAPKMTAVFEGIREAYDHLLDDAKRRVYLSGLERKANDPGSQSGERAGQAAELFKRAELAMKKREFVAAEEQYEQAHALDPKAVYLAGRAWALYLDPIRRDVARARQLMSEALKLDSACDRAHYQLGVLARMEGDVDKAERHFREAARVNPKHLEANQELRLIDMRKRGSKRR